MASRPLGVKELSVRAAGPELDAVLTPEHLGAVAGIAVEAIAQLVAL